MDYERQWRFESHIDDRNPSKIFLCFGTENVLLTLQHCLDARAALAQIHLVAVVMKNDFPEFVFSTKQLADDHIKKQPVTQSYPIEGYSHRTSWRSYILGLDDRVEKKP